MYISELEPGTWFWLNEDINNRTCGIVLDEKHAYIPVRAQFQLYERTTYSYKDTEMIKRAGSSVYWDSNLYDKTKSKIDIAKVIPNKAIVRHLEPQKFWCTTPPGLIRKLGKGKEVEAYAQLPGLSHFSREYVNPIEGEFNLVLSNLTNSSATRTPASDHSLYMSIKPAWRDSRPTSWPKFCNLVWVIIQHDGLIKLGATPTTKGMYYAQPRYVALSNLEFNYSIAETNLLGLLGTKKE